MELQFTKELKLTQKWDEFIINNDKGSHLLLTDWLQSYKGYGFDFELGLITEKGEVIGGYGAVIAKVSFFKFYIVPFGPIVLNDREDALALLLEQIPMRAKLQKCCYCQINYPVGADSVFSNHYYASVEEHYFEKYQKGHLFKYVYSSNGLNWVDLKKYTSLEEILMDFKSSVRRDIRSSERKGLKAAFLETEEEIKAGYHLCLENALKANYSLRDWNSFKETLLTLIQNRSAKFIACYKEKELKGAILLVKSGNYYTYILGGTKKEKPDLLAGHFLQWEALKLSFESHCDGYNISLGGPDGVQEFKNSFNTQQVFFDNGKYYIILKPIVFRLFLSFEKIIKPYKNKIAKIISKLK